MVDVPPTGSVEVRSYSVPEREFWERVFLCIRGLNVSNCGEAAASADAAADEWRKRWGPEGCRR